MKEITINSFLQELSPSVDLKFFSKKDDAADSWQPHAVLLFLLDIFKYKIFFPFPQNVKTSEDYAFKILKLTLSKTSPGFYVSAIDVF